MAITCSVRMRGGGIDSFLGFEYCVVITLASREFRVLPILPMSLQCLRIFGFVRVAWCCDPTSRFRPVRSLYWVLGLCGVRPGYFCVGDDRWDDYSADSSASLAQCCSCGGFFPSFKIFALVWGLMFFLRNFRFWCCLFLLRLSILLFSLSYGS